MADTTTSQYMGMPVPVVGVDQGPQFATDLNSCLAIIDQHTHASGSGVPITPVAININGDLTFGSNSATNLKSAVFVVPSVQPSTQGAVYYHGVDFYINDFAGHQIQLTSSGGVAGTPGSIGGISGTANVTYSAPTFVFQSASGVSGNLDGGSVILRDTVAAAKGVTLKSPSSLAADYSLTMPAALPGSQKIVTIDSSGNVASNYGVDGTTISITSNVIGVVAGGIGTTQLADSGVTTGKIADGAVTNAKSAAVNYNTSSSCGSFSSSSGSFVDVTNLSAAITTVGRPIMVAIQSDGSGVDGYLVVSRFTSGQVSASIKILRGSTVIANYLMAINGAISGSILQAIPTSISYIDDGPVGSGTASYTYKVQVSVTGGSMNWINAKLRVIEL